MGPDEMYASPIEFAVKDPGKFDFIFHQVVRAH